MDKEKEIEELTKTIIEHHCYQHGCDYCGWYESRKGCEDKLIYADLARYLIEEAGYRKADEVRKEAAIKILRELWANAEFETLYDNDDGGYVRLGELEQVAEKYGVEVDE